MNCRKYRDLMAAAALGELSESDKRGFDTHLEGCESCRTEFERMRQLSQLLAVDPGDSLSELDRLRLENSVYRRLAEPSVWPKYGRNHMPRTLIRIAAALVLVGLGYLAHPLLSQESQPNPALTTQPIASTLTVYERDLPAGSRFTAGGFKVIAHGRKAAIEEFEKSLRTRPQ